MTNPGPSRKDLRRKRANYCRKSVKLATIGAVYSVSMILLLTCIGAVVFRQPLNACEVVGLGMAIGSLILLMRFA